MAHRYYIGCDNGVSGTFGITSSDPEFEQIIFQTPTFSEQNYTKKKANITRIDTNKLKELLLPYTDNCIILLERPLVNPGRFKATISAVRALEATLIVIEQLQIPYIYLDSKEWQKALLPSGIKGSAELKKASVDIGRRLFPMHSELIKKHKDADGLLIAEYAKRQRF